jgi:hypothetical protein
MYSGTWVGPCRHDTIIQCFVPLPVVFSRHGRHVGPCRYGTVKSFLRPKHGPWHAGTSLGRADPSTALKISLLVSYIYIYIYIYISCVYYFNESLNDFHNLLRGNIVNARKLHCRVVEVSTCHFVPYQPKHGPICGPSHVSHRAEILGTTRLSYSCRAGTTQNTSCRPVLRVMPEDRASPRSN